MVPYYGAADVFILPTYYDACSLVVIEAMACGLPTITTEYNGAAELIRNDVNGFVISHPPQGQDLIFAMNSLLVFKTRYQMSKEAATTAMQYSLEKNFDAMLFVFNQVLKK
jgi:UDP-glucose:(heptosyl)LPS alpha-1,3-glucosyltransferase